MQPCAALSGSRPPTDGGGISNHTQEFDAWLKACPFEFPKHIDITESIPDFLNPVIGTEFKGTCQNIRHVLEMFRSLAFPSCAEAADFSLSEEGTLGFITTLECLIYALRFEVNHRNYEHRGFDNDLED